MEDGYYCRLNADGSMVLLLGRVKHCDGVAIGNAHDCSCDGGCVCAGGKQQGCEDAD